jgi:predicted nucleic acid-binding protein
VVRWSRYRTCYFCRQTQQGFLRLANDPRVMQAEAVPMGEAWRLYDIAMTDVRMEFAEEPSGLEGVWRRYTGGQSFSPKLWNDAYLSAFAETGGYEVVSFDHGFNQFQGVRSTILT